MLEDSAAILSRANQALATLERYKLRLDEVSGTLSALEIEDLVTVRDVAAVAQRLEMVRRIAGEIEGYVVELGTDGRLLSLQLDELMAGVDAGAGAGRPRLPAAPPQGRPDAPRPCWSSWRPCRSTTCSTLPRSRPGAAASPAAPTRWTTRSARAATGCWPGCPGCRHR